MISKHSENQAREEALLFRETAEVVGVQMGSDASQLVAPANPREPWQPHTCGTSGQFSCGLISTVPQRSSYVR